MAGFVRRRLLPSGEVRYCPTVTVDGRKRQVGSYRRKKEAEARLRSVEYELASGIFDRPSITFASLVDRWLQHIRHSVKANTLVDYQQTAKNHLLPFYGNTPLSKITEQDVQRYVEVKLEVLSPRTVNKTITTLKSMLQQAVRWNLLDESPARFVTRPREVHREMDYLTPAEVRRLLVASPAGYRALFATAVFTGLRQGELLALRWSDLDADSAVLYVRRSYHPEHGFTEPKTTRAAGRLPSRPA